MKTRYALTFTLLLIAISGPVSAQTNAGKSLNPIYVESCIRSQVQAHQKIKEITPNDFRAYCECTAKQLVSNLNSTQLDELSKGSKSPTWLKSAEDSASKACLKPSSTTQT
ncbi:hypothetical protein ICN46_02010 [Polynucleobacter sp. Latsch14-2]|jgi:hypothetical protein|uniref:hypothetical protein n=1 Tax=Polynucleobacter sp. Latsch14-2 TaxID=2576920 RepID=UPI001C0DE046|nr:hypothetical protein [Polynucleobacter sp. Latsch14-2]MBU3613673.1 hypothetical protein [Polynucleobacter sp. Latsch14-2]